MTIDHNNRPLAFFTGGNTAFNLRRTTLNLGWMLSETFNLDIITTNPRGFGNEIREHFRLVGGKHSQTTRGAVAALDAYLAEEDPAVVLNVIKPPLHGLIVSALARRHGVPAVYRYSGDRFLDHKVNTGLNKVLYFGLSNAIGRIPLLLAGTYVTLGPTGTERLTNRGVAREEITELPVPIDSERFTSVPDPDLDIPSNRSVALFVGRFSRLKGFKTLERVIPKVLERRNDLQFVLVGGERSPDIPKRYADHVTVVGRVPPNRMPAYFRAADVLIHPSLTEGLPRVVLEAMASDTPVIVRDVGDVASMTDNTFRREDTFVDMLCSFESLPIDDVTPFTRQSLKSTYIEFFEQFYG